GRVSYPWCRTGHEALAEPLFEAVLEAMRRRGLKKAFTAYRGDWPQQAEVFQAHPFRLPREMINYALDLAEPPTSSHRPGSPIVPLTREDVPGLLRLAPEALRTDSASELERHLFANPYFPPESLFVPRSRTDGSPVAAGILIANAAYAHPRQV